MSVHRRAEQPDSVGGTDLVEHVAAAPHRAQGVVDENGYPRHLLQHTARLGIDMEIVQRPPRARGFTPLPARWAVERTLGMFGNLEWSGHGPFGGGDESPGRRTQRRDPMVR